MSSTTWYRVASNRFFKLSMPTNPCFASSSITLEMYGTQRNIGANCFFTTKSICALGNSFRRQRSNAVVRMMSPIELKRKTSILLMLVGFTIQPLLILPNCEVGQHCNHALLLYSTKVFAKELP